MTDMRAMKPDSGERLTFSVKRLVVMILIW